MAGAGGMVGALRPSFFAPDSEVRGFGPLGAGATLISERSAIASPVGVLADGTRVFSLARLDAEDSEAQEEVCPNTRGRLVLELAVQSGPARLAEIRLRR